MDSNYRDSCREGYFPNDREPPENRQPQQQMAHFPHQLPYHSATLVSPLQQSSYVLEQQDQLRSREEYGAGQNAPTMLRSIYPVSMHSSNVLLPASEHFPQTEQQSQHQQPQPQQQQQQQLARFQPTTRPEYIPTPPAHINNSLQGHTTSATSQGGGQHVAQPRDLSSEQIGLNPSGPLELSTRRNSCGSNNKKSGAQVQKPKQVAIAAQPKQPKQQVPQPPKQAIVPLLKRLKDSAKRESSAMLPEFLRFKYKPNERENIGGILAVERVEEGMEFGPYDGNLLDEAVGSTKDSTWELCTGGKVFFYVDGTKKEKLNWMSYIQSARSEDLSPATALCTGGKVFFYVDGTKKEKLNWMSYIQSARSEDEQNLQALQHYGQIYFQTTKVIEPTSELKVFYNPEYASQVGFKTGLKDLKYDEGKGAFQCPSCETQFTSSKRMIRHIKFDHDSETSDETYPVITINWKVKPQHKQDSRKVEAAPKVPKERTKEKEQDKVPDDVASKFREVKCEGGDSKQFICTVCGKKFATAGRREAHAMFHEIKNEHSCLICGAKQGNPKALAKHMARHDERPHNCPKCKKGYKSQNALHRHMREIHGLPGKEYACRICASVFGKKSECFKHEREHDAERDSQALRVTNELWKKKKYRKGNVSEGDQDAENFESAGKTAGDNDSLLENKRKKGPKSRLDPEEPKDMLGKTINYYDRARPFKCRYCSRTYTSRTAAYEHEKEEHEGKGTYKCNLCPRVFVKECSFLNHYQKHEQNRLYRCSQCPRTFASDTALKNHQGEHTGLKPYKCEICGKGFRIRKWVCAHKRRMHKVRVLRYFCSTCNKGFTDKGPLIKHERRHKGIRPFVCLICGKGFGVKYVLEVHMRSVHADEKRYRCEFCGKKFNLNQHYVTHMFKHKVQGEQMAEDATEVQQEDQVQPLQQQQQQEQEPLQP